MGAVSRRGERESPGPRATGDPRVLHNSTPFGRKEKHKSRGRQSERPGPPFRGPDMKFFADKVRYESNNNKTDRGSRNADWDGAIRPPEAGQVRSGSAVLMALRRRRRRDSRATRGRSASCSATEPATALSVRTRGQVEPISSASSLCTPARERARSSLASTYLLRRARRCTRRSPPRARLRGARRRPSRG